jgi:Zn-dependent protease with chaperone function
MKPKLKLIKDSKFLSLILKDSIKAITLAPFGIYFKTEKVRKSVRTVNHEKIHWKQQLEMLKLGTFISLIIIGLLLSFKVFTLWIPLLMIFPFLFFYLWYFIEWIIKSITTTDAYRSLSFEREAYDNDDNTEYLETRKRYAWFKHIIKKK